MISAPVELPTRESMTNDKQTPVASRYGDMVGPVGIDLHLAHHISLSNASESWVLQIMIRLGRRASLGYCWGIIHMFMSHQWA